MTDWRIIIEPIGEGEAGVLEVVAGEQQDAIDALEGWAETIMSLGFVPDSLEWRARPGCAVTGRAGKTRFRVRCDAFERETETGMSTGSGWLYVREDPIG